MLDRNDDYAELTVEGKPRSVGIGLLILAVVMILVGFYGVLCINSMLPRKWIMLGSILIVAYIFFGAQILSNLCRKKSVDYDYLYVDNDLEIAEIYNKSKRKHVVTIHMEHAKRIAPAGSQALLGYEGKGIDRVRDFTSGAEDVVPYKVLVEKDGKVIEILLEPDAHMLALIGQRNKDIFYSE